RSDVDAVRARAGGIMGSLDRRGWNAGTADSAWNAARSGMVTLGSNLDKRASDLDWRAGLLDEYENGAYSGGVPWGMPLQDPVNSYTGNLVHSELDLRLPTRGGLPLHLSR